MNLDFCDSQVIVALLNPCPSIYNLFSMEELECSCENVIMGDPFLFLNPAVASLLTQSKSQRLYSGLKIPTWSLWSHCHHRLSHSTCSSCLNIPESKTVHLAKFSLGSSSPRNLHNPLPHHLQASAEHSLPGEGSPGNAI